MDTTAPGTRPLVVGYDGSDTAEAALAWAADLAALTTSPLHVLHAAERVSIAHEEAIALWSSQRVEETTRAVAEHGAELARTRHPGLTVVALASLLGPVAALDEASRDARAVVVGTHGRGRVAGAVLGSTAYALSGHATCPVVVVPRHGAPLPGAARPVVVGTDGSAGGARAVRAAADLAAAAGAPLHVVTSYHPPVVDRWGMPPLGYDSVEEAADVWSDAARTTAGEAADEVRGTHPGLEVRTSAPEGRPEDALRAAEPGPGLLAVGARGLGPLAALVLGSTSRAVLHTAAVPVLVTR